MRPFREAGSRASHSPTGGAGSGASVDAEREAQMRYIMIANTPNNYVCITVHSAHGLKDASGWISTMVRTPAFMPWL